ncbi:MAG: hypothetical protein PVI50_05455 [Gammaproteobacteria bacterium]|jgi:hypothetical protein
MIQPFPHRPAAGNRHTPASTTTPRGAAGTPWAAIITILLLQAPFVQAEQFTPPSLEGFSLHSERDADGDSDGVEETHIMQYMNTNADSLFSMTTNGRTWAWSLNTRDTETGPSNYVIRDSDCDGVFDEVYGLDEEFHVPDCVK